MVLTSTTSWPVSQRARSKSWTDEWSSIGAASVIAPVGGRPLRPARVECGEAQELDPPRRPVRHPAPRLRERDVVASLESHLDVRSGAFHDLDEGRGAGQVLGQRLLAQRGDPRGDRGLHAHGVDR